MLYALFVAFVGLLAASPSSAVLFKNIQCDSNGYAYKSCSFGLSGSYVIINATVIRQDSTSACTFGSSFGFSGTFMWVHHGCRALFNVRMCRNVKTLDCDSWNYAYAVCRVPGATYVNHVMLTSVRSSAPCTQHHTFGIADATVWVASGCRASFTVCTDSEHSFRSEPVLTEELNEI